MEWGPGCLFPPEGSDSRDPSTGVRIRQLTSSPCRNYLPGPLAAAFTPEGDALLFISERDGGPQLFELMLPGGRIRQLTGGPAIHPLSPLIHPSGEKVFFACAGSLWSLDRRTLEQRCVVSFGQARIGECALAGDWLAAAVRQGLQHGLIVGRTDGTRWDFFPLSRPVLRPQFHPLEHEWLEFASHPAPRMHRIRRDGAGLECLYHHDADEFIVHEAFLGQTGDLLFVRWPEALCRMDWQSRRIRTLAEFSAWHLSSNRAGTRILCDTNGPDEGVFLVDAVTGARQLACLTGSSNQGSQWRTGRADPGAALGPGCPAFGPEWTHPHPVFSPDELQIAFTSDRTGHPQVYLAGLEDLPAPPYAGPVM